MNDKPIYVAFYDKKLESTFETLKKGTSEQKRLYKFINRAISDLTFLPRSPLPNNRFGGG